MMANKDEKVELAKLAEQAERYVDMVNVMKEVVQSKNELTLEERNLLSIAYKNVIGSYREPYRIISTIEMRVQDNEHEKEMVKRYRKKIENELKDVCYEILDLLDKYLFPNVTSNDEKVFYLKMKGDYYRYLAEIGVENEGKKWAEESKNAYKDGYDLAQNEMIVTHPIRLGLALNFSVFYYEIANEFDVACRLAKEAFDNALSELDCINDKNVYRDSLIIMQLLRDNLKIWSETEMKMNNEEEEEES
ncbi:unnamed protein product [Adineta ricciae]|uniref:14-3-3 domain-containing protein n=1 Tax=Adineta ricciae TaxID=249248 RepID=A0A813S570_ADIRI|nr:unnamed protein product [Adineta ricciae]CAF1350053.1 unnamed protein product [Adineta ricciae]